MALRVALLAILALGALLSVVAPLATYSVTLAAFGLPHVLTELRYVDQRYASRAPRLVLVSWALLLGAVVAGRTLVFAGALDRRVEVGAELFVIAALAYTTWGLPAGRPALARVAAAIAASALVIGATLAPATTIVSLAVLHNLTPLGFFAEVLRPRDLALAAVALLGTPLVIATGVPTELLVRALSAGAAVDPLDVAPLSSHLAVYVPTGLQQAGYAEDLFRAAVYGQWAHYVAVIGVLPLLARPADAAAAIAPWPRSWAFAAAVTAVTLPLFAAFASDFSQARSMYGFVAAVHAWIEVPVLLWVIGGASGTDPAPSHPIDALEPCSYRTRR